MTDFTEDAPQPATTARRKWRPAMLWLFAGFAVFAYAFDQLTKLWVTSTMTEGERIPVLPPLLHWYYIRNSGAAFSIGENVTWIFTIVMAAVSVAILFQLRRLGSAWWALSLGLLLGGALGNLTDRLFREPSFAMGHVVDFIQLPNFAIFNIADSAVVSGVVIICLLTLRGIGMDGTRQTAAPKGSDHAKPASGSQGEPAGE
ncbi:signal peptidase II [Paenarthrobacter nicotinovorans]|uniref:Lipoprotein signal peptidase n=1 Tax=Paenarthrobacter nicotinovorans TaxID=29320 RepID=A0ABV0GXY3_PAENI|nr:MULTISPECIES: signal peptidase II [Micrococcaceae]MDR6439123.1 signal peptidase II [Paenarthrobacter nicotinovorans]SCZ65443.1 signal peptidase II [Arthrobacter sp. UNCCL28]